MHKLTEKHFPFLALKGQTKSITLSALHTGPRYFWLFVFGTHRTVTLHLANATKESGNWGHSLQKDHILGVFVGFIGQAGPVDGLVAISTENNFLLLDL